MNDRTTIEGLFAEREIATEALRRLDVFYERQSRAEATLGEIDRGIDALDRAERQSVEAWASGASTVAPEPMIAERRALLGRRLDAEAERQSAIAGADAVRTRRDALTAELSRIHVAVLQYRVSAALETAFALHREAKATAEKIAEPLQQIEGIRRSIATFSNSGEIAGNPAARNVLFAALGQIDRLEKPNVMSDPAKIAEHAAQWLEKIR